MAPSTSSWSRNATSSGGADVERQAVEAELVEAKAAAAAQADAQAAARAEELRQLRSGRSGAKLKYCTLASSIGHSVTSCAVVNSQCVSWPRAISERQRAAARHGVAPDQIRVGRVDAEARHQHRRQRREEVRVDRLEQVRDQARLLGLELELHARRQEGEALEQALDVGIGDLHALDAEARRDLRELARELRADLAQVRQLVAVEAQEARVHGRSAGR